MATIDYRPNVPPEVKAAVSEHLPDMLPLLPTWVHEVIVRWDDNDENPAAASWEHHYRYLRIHIGPSFMSVPRDRRYYIRHEVVHALTGPLVQFVRTHAFPHIENEDVRRLLEQELRERLEAVTCDIEYAFRKLTDGA